MSQRIAQGAEQRLEIGPGQGQQALELLGHLDLAAQAHPRRQSARGAACRQPGQAEQGAGEGRLGGAVRLHQNLKAGGMSDQMQRSPQFLGMQCQRLAVQLRQQARSGRAVAQGVVQSPFEQGQGKGIVCRHA